MSEQQPVWNTVMPVIANVAAATAEEAEHKLAAALQKAGFDLLDPASSGDPVSLATFRAQDGTEAWVLPGEDRPQVAGHPYKCPCDSCTETPPGLPAGFRHH